MEREGQLSAREVEAMARQNATGGGWSDANRGWSSGAGRGIDTHCSRR